MKSISLALRGMLIAVLALATVGNQGACEATIDRAVIQGETMTGAGQVVNDTNADGGKALLITGNATVSKTFTTDGPSDRLLVRARDTMCNGAPTMKVSIDGVARRDVQLNSTRYVATTYVGVGAGQHTLKIGMANDSYGGPQCDRNLYIDYSLVQDTNYTSPAPQEPPRIQGAVIDSDWFNDPSLIDQFNAKVGAQVRMVMTYDRFGEHGIKQEKVSVPLSKGATPVLTLEPRVMSLQSITNGDYDVWIDQFANMVAQQSNGKPVMVRFAHEMNGNWFPWGQQPAAYKAAYRHLHDRIEAKAPNVIHVWSPNVERSLGDYYPGDAYVDWMGLDGYNFDGNKSATQVYNPSYDVLQGLNPNKPVMVAEGASDQYPGKAAWITDLYNTAIPNRMPNIRAFVWFDVNKERDWRINSSPESLTAYKNAVAQPEWKGSMQP